ncbi:CoA transferase [Exilibacterium tricleocarpae]|uniref:CoA transferase n=1 Tax=Exilibacterium tricleocarpae TaxID=2591008 RepID=A0A545TVJ0_9GAMM|nr:CoA transferase [Exilibacterium tricleocarpae]TQV81236.1 CoA transferase [Exilibacterium tricleocarpae]
MAGPLAGVRILELTSVVLGPWACQMLGDLGAEVIKIEPPGGDTNRNLGPHRHDKQMCSLYLTCNRNKQSVVLDLKAAEGREAALRLAAGVDVLIHNFRPRAMQRLGLDYEAVQARNPTIIYCATYGYSKDGPYGDKGALDDSIQAASGIAMLQSMVEGEPRYLPTIVADKTTALTVVQAVLAALFHRERSGEGQALEVPMFESMVSYVMTEHLWGLTFEPPIGQAGYTRLMSQQRRPYKTQDGYLAVLPYWDNHWKTFCECAGRPDLLADPRFINMRERLNNIDASYAATAEVIATKTTQAWIDLLGETNVPMMVVNTLDGLIDDPHLKASGFWQLFEHPTEGTLRMSKPPINFEKTPAEIRSLAPALGENSRDVLRAAGYSPEQIEALAAAGITTIR